MPPLCLWCPSLFFLSVSDLIIMASRDTVGDAAYYFLVYARFFLPSAHVRILILLYILCGSNIKDSGSSYISFLDILLESIGSNLLLLLIWDISDDTACSSFYQKLLITTFNPYC